MVVHGDDFIVAGDGGDLDWLLHKLNEKHELVQKARLGPGYDSEATVLNRCATYSDSGLTWEADPRHAGLSVAELGLQAARPQTSQQDWHIWHRTDLTLPSLARSTVVQSGKQHVLISLV